MPKGTLSDVCLWATFKACVFSSTLALLAVPAICVIAKAALRAFALRRHHLISLNSLLLVQFSRRRANARHVVPSAHERPS